MSNKTNTHYYDGKLHERKFDIDAEIEKASKIPHETKLLQFQKLGEKLGNLLNGSAQRSLHVIIQEFKNRGRDLDCQNYDPTNKLFADDLLWLCCEKVENDNKDRDFSNLLVAQLTEMKTGLCAQGRTTRLFQILVL